MSQQARQQQVRYVLSMAREFPETLRRLAETGEVTFGLRLEQLERHSQACSGCGFPAWT